MQSIVASKEQLQGHGVAVHIVSTARRQREMNAGAPFGSLFIQTKTTADGTVPPTFRFKPFLSHS